jgi:hypothetical protein
MSDETKLDLDDGDEGLEITPEEREWMKTPEGAAMRRKEMLRQAAEHARKGLAMADDFRADLGEERFGQLLEDPDPEHDALRQMVRNAAEARRFLARSDGGRSRVEGN